MKPRLKLNFANWPEADRDMWVSMQKAGGLLEDPGALSGLRTTSLRSLEISYSRWLGWLSRLDAAILLEPPASRSTLERLQAWLESELEGSASYTSVMYVGDVVRVLSGFSPKSDWQKHRRLVRILHRKAKSHRSERKTGRVLSSGVLFDAGLELASRHADMATTELKAQKRRRDGAMVAFLALLPLRSRSMIELTIGSSIEITPSAIHIRLDGSMTKNGLPWDARVPDQLQPVLRQYLKEVRPWFMARGGEQHDRFWVIDWGRPFSGLMLRIKISNATERMLGVRVSTHLFRDAAATTLSRFSPEHARMIRPLLGHSSLGTAELHYIQANTIQAGRGHADVIGEIMGQRRE